MCSPIQMQFSFIVITDECTCLSFAGRKLQSSSLTIGQSPAEQLDLQSTAESGFIHSSAQEWWITCRLVRRPSCIIPALRGLTTPMVVCRQASWWLTHASTIATTTPTKGWRSRPPLASLRTTSATLPAHVRPSAPALSPLRQRYGTFSTQATKAGAAGAVGAAAPQERVRTVCWTSYSHRPPSPMPAAAVILLPYLPLYPYPPHPLLPPHLPHSYPWAWPGSPRESSGWVSYTSRPERTVMSSLSSWMRCRILQRFSFSPPWRR